MPIRVTMEGATVLTWKIRRDIQTTSFLSSANVIIKATLAAHRRVE